VAPKLCRIAVPADTPTHNAEVGLPNRNQPTPGLQTPSTRQNLGRRTEQLGNAKEERPPLRTAFHFEIYAAECLSYCRLRNSTHTPPNAKRESKLGSGM
jgi:hypothetical protein